MSETYYYVSGNTAEGFQNLLPTNVDTIDQKIFIKHPSQALKTMLFNDIIRQFKTSHDVEVFYSSKGKPYLEGVVIRDQSLAIIDNILNTGRFTDAEQIDLTTVLGESDSDVARLRDTILEVDELIRRAHYQFAEGLKIHDDLEAIYIHEMNFKSADRRIEQFISEEVHNIPAKQTPSKVYRRMFGRSVNVISELIRSVPKKYILKGRAGTGKSVFMKRVAEACKEKGLDLELYHCSFDPSSIDMVCVREHFCIMDGTSPHEMSPTRSSDVVIDLYELTVTPGTDEKYAEEIEKITQNYQSYMKAGKDLLTQAIDLQSEQEDVYFNALAQQKKDVAIENLHARLF